MRNIFVILLFFSALLVSCGFREEEPAQSHIVLVSIAPYKHFVEQIAGDTVEVKMMVPSGGSPHSYEPSARQILNASRADIWFRIGETFEDRAIEALSGYRKQMEIVDMRDGIEMLSEEETSHHHCPHHACKDPHIWLSPRLVKKQAKAIAKSLSQVYPEHAEAYSKALQKFIKNLDDLDLELSQILRSIRGKTILVSHPAYAYLCKDYGISQLSIEFEGKEPTPQHLTELLQGARESGSKTVFVQAQHAGKGARLVAEELNASVVELNPLGENYFENMRYLAKSLAAAYRQ